MGAVAARAQASKETLYRHFTDRTGLFIAVLKRFADSQIASCPQAPKDETLEAGLRRLGQWYLAMATRADGLSFYRFVVGTAEEMPDLGLAFTTHVTAPILKEIESFLCAHVPRKEAPALAQHYLGLLQGKFWNRALVEPGHPIKPRDVSEQAARAATLMARALDADHG